jgi:class 3 adenylate cyclase/tetratricopeptide (TPR) repeat protein
MHVSLADVRPTGTHGANSVICPACGAPNAVDRRFCLECGSGLSATCPSCGAPNEPAAKFCGSCGNRLASGAATGIPTAATAAANLRGTVASAPSGTTAAVPVAERRVVTVLFVDLVGFTSISEDRDAESVRELLSVYFDVAGEIIGRYGGTIEKFIGDAVMAMWGAPTAFEDDAERAVRAALDIVDAIPAVGSEAGVELQARAGVLTGEAAVTLGASGQGMVAGDLVNTASRIQSVAPPGTVLVGERTREAAGGAVTFEPAGEHVLKGKTSPVPAFRALRVVAERGGARRTDVIEPPFVGRGDQLRLLKEQFHATGRERRARVVSLVGQAGIGKSRLAWELEKYLDGVVENVWWHRGRSPAYGSGVTFWALGEMIRRRAGLAEGDDDETTRVALATMLDQHVPDDEERRWIELRLLVLLGLEDAPAGGREELFAAWRTFFERIAATGTVALVFEDVQWADDGLLDFIEHLLDWSRNQPIFVVTLARPDLLERRPGWGTDRPGAVSMRLEPLPEAAMRELLAGIAPGLPEQAVDRILDRATGIPLYAVETIRMFLADGRLALDADGQAQLAGELGDIDVPQTLQALVAARLDALPPADRSLLQDASVLGQSFTLAAVAAVSGEEADALAPRLAGLVRRELLVVENDPRSPGRGQHAFIQSIIREVAYATLSRRDRRSRHVAAARYFESLGDEELAGVLATHYLAAYRAAPDGPEGAAIAAQARIALRAAADRAEALGAIAQAIESLRSAIDVTADRNDHPVLLIRIAELEGISSRYEEADRDAVAAEELARELGDTVTEFAAIVRRAILLVDHSRIAEGLALTERVESVANALGDDVASQTALASYAEVRARALFRAERLDDCIPWADRALAVGEPLRLDHTVAQAMVTKGTALCIMGRRREGIALLEGAYRDATTHGLHLAALRAGNNLSSFLGDTEPHLALEWARSGMAAARRLGMSSMDTYHAGNFSYSARRTGDWEVLRAALAELLEGTHDPQSTTWLRSLQLWADVWRGEDGGGRPAEMLRDAEASGDAQMFSNALNWSMEIAYAAGDIATANRVGQRIMGHAAASPYNRFSTGRMALHDGDRATAERVLERITPSMGGACDGDVAALRAGIAALDGRIDDALRDYRTALAVYEDAGLSFDVALTALDLATFLGPDQPAVRAAAAKGREILASLGATPLLERLDARTAGSTHTVETPAGAIEAPEATTRS